MKKKFFICIFIVFLTTALIYRDPKDKNDRSHTLIVAFDSKIISADPRMIGSDPGSQYIEELRFLPLISFDSEGNLKNVLAEQIRYEGTKIIITLKKGVHFANGSEITSADVESTYRAILTPKESAPPNPRKSLFGEVLSVAAHGPGEIIFTIKRPDASFINNLIVGILPKIAIQTEPIGNLMGKNYESGPFKLNAVKENQWSFEANQNFDYAAKPKLSAFIIKIIPDSTTRYAALIKGDIDLIQNSLDPDKINLIEKSMSNQFQVLKGTKLATTYIGFNFRDPILKQKKIRQALAYALDTSNILKYRLRSSERRANGLFPEYSFYYNSNLPNIVQDKEATKHLLEESGLSLPISIRLAVSGSNKTNIEIAKTMAIGLKDVGFDIQVENLENSVFFQRLNRGLIQMWLAPWTGFKDPDHMRFIFSSSMFPPSGANRGHYSNSELDAMLEMGRTEFNRLKRKEIYLKAQELISNDLPYIYLWHGMNVAIASKRVHGYELYADGRYWSLVNTTLDAQK